MAEAPRLDGRVALVTGASRGVGKGVAEELAACGATVYATGRTVAETDFAVPCRPLPCDHTDDAQVEAAFARIGDEAGGPELLVTAAWGGYERMVEDGEYTWERPFWRQPAWRWDAMFAAGVRAAYVAASHAARGMVARGGGLIVHLSYWSAQKHLANVAYGAAKAATDKMSADMAHELAGTGVAAVSLYPGLVRTEKVMAAAEHLDLSRSESPRFVGRAVAALAADPEVATKSGRVLVAAELAREYGFTDLDGRRPPPLTLAEA